MPSLVGGSLFGGGFPLTTFSIPWMMPVLSSIVMQEEQMCSMKQSVLRTQTPRGCVCVKLKTTFKKPSLVWRI